MDIAFLGTGSGYPTPNRGASAIALRYEGDVWLIDCGEGTQIQIMKLKTIKPGNISKIFITHLHGDHMFGLPGLMCTISMALKPTDEAVPNTVLTSENQTDSTNNIIEIYGPVGLRRFLREALHLSRSVLSYQYVVHELVPENDQYSRLRTDDVDWNCWNPDHLAKGPLHPSELKCGHAIYLNKTARHWSVCQTKNITVLAGQLEHRIPSFGYVFVESSKTGKLKSKKLKELGIPKGPIFGRIKNGEVVTLDDGRIINPSDFVGPTQPGRKVAVLQDSCNSWFMKDMCQNCDVLIHEATNENMHTEQCVKNGHSTPEMAATFADETRSQMLVITHVSQRYKHKLTHELRGDDATTDILEEEARSKFSGPVLAAYDGLVLNVKRNSLCD